MKATLADAMQLFMEGSIALAKAEAEGICIDMPYLERVSKKVEAKIQSLQDELKNDEVYKVWRRKFGLKTNLTSRFQLGEVLFKEMDLPYKGDFTKTGRFKTDETILTLVDIPFVKKLLQVEDLKRLKSNNLDGLKREVVHGFLHPFFNLAGGGEDDKGGARSYRSSSAAINFQALPNRDPILRKIIRRCFIPRSPRNCLIEIDYAAHEFRIAACFWRDPEMVLYASDPTKDIHRDMAARCFAIPNEEVTKDLRYYGKNGFVFPRLYGSYYPQIARKMWIAVDQKGLKSTSGTPIKQILKEQGIAKLGACDPKKDPQKGTFEWHLKKVETNFDKQFSTFAKSREKWFKQYRELGWFPMLTGFRIEGLYTKNAVMNYGIQGPAFHCLLWSLIRLQKWLTDNEFITKIIAQIHDCILLDGPANEVKAVLKIAKKIMTQDIRKAWDWIIVPLDIEAQVTDPGCSWYEKKPMKIPDT